MRSISELAKELRELQDICKRVADTIEELSAKPTSENMMSSSQHNNDGWIPCDERLPENFEEVLVTIKGVKGVRTGQYFSEGKEWGISENTFCRNKVIAWMPFPEEYVEK